MHRRVFMSQEQGILLPELDDGKSISQEIIPHYYGHRERLREKLFDGAGKGLQDYELLELLLFSAIPRKDIKPLAKDLLAHYHNLRGVFYAEPSQLKEKFKLSDTVISLLKVSVVIVDRLARHQISEQTVIGSWQELLHYCTVTMGHEKVEQFRVLFLDQKNKLIADEVLSKGTVNQTSVYPREVMKRAIELSAMSLILVHNHPSGDTKPSRADIEMTKEIQNAGRVFGIKIFDHIIISSTSHASFQNLGLLN